MLTMVYGRCEETIYKTPEYFDMVFKREWLNTELAKEMILDIDKSFVLGDMLIESPVFGLMPPQWLSGGVKTLLLIYNMPNKIFNGSQLGNNCAKWLLKMTEDKDLTVWFGHVMDFDEPGTLNMPIKVKIEWDNRTKSKIVYSMREMASIVCNEEIRDFYTDPDKLLERMRSRR